ncbi:hypothetical protein PybrP1_002105 [[Pythium] brassicae (nom. inval.)]|nr:hypothetical protein PybrP1_002105 [[Pythium] brassicae (nom. inval.)]
MGRAYDGKKRWTETVLRAGHGATASASSSGTGGNGRKRFSGRTMKLSAAMRRVDDETRAIVRNARLDALEGDGGGGAEDDEAASDGAYVDEEDGSGASKDKKAARSRSKKVANNKTRKWKVKSLAQLVFEEHGAAADLAPDAPPTYLSVAAAASTRPPRRFCCVCGFFAPYACTRCGSRYCRIKCGDQHKESGCLKFGL